MAKSKTSKRYTREFRREMIELHRAGRSIPELSKHEQRHREDRPHAVIGLDSIVVVSLYSVDRASVAQVVSGLAFPRQMSNAGSAKVYASVPGFLAHGAIVAKSASPKGIPYGYAAGELKWLALAPHGAGWPVHFELLPPSGPPPIPLPFLTEPPVNAPAHRHRTRTRHCYGKRHSLHSRRTHLGDRQPDIAW
jgi:hypothetical protein